MKNKLACVLAIISYILLFYLQFYKVDALHSIGGMQFGDIKVFYIQSITLSMVICFAYGKMKTASNIFYTITFLLMILVIYNIYAYDLYQNLGFVLYIICFIILVISCIIFNSNEPINNQTENNKINTNENINNNKKLLIGKFVLGIKEIPLNTITVIENSVENRKLIFTFKIENNINKLEIGYDEITDINIRQSVIMSSNKVNNVDETDKKVAMELLGVALFGSFGAIIGDEMGNLVAGYEKMNYDNVWEVTLSYNDKKIMISFNVDPTDFINVKNH